jgi:hypothetical protein
MDCAGFPDPIWSRNNSRCDPLYVASLEWDKKTVINIIFFRWSVIGFFLNAHACGTPPDLAYQAAHSNILVDRDRIRSLLGITVILQSEEQGYAFIMTGPPDLI